MGYTFGQSVTIERGGTIDAYGDPVPGVTTQVVEGCAIAWIGARGVSISADIIDRGRSGVTEGLTVLMPAGTVIETHDVVIVDGQRYEVEGRPAAWASPFSGWVPGVRVALWRAVG